MPRTDSAAHPIGEVHGADPRPLLQQSSESELASSGAAGASRPASPALILTGPEPQPQQAGSIRSAGYSQAAPNGSLGTSSVLHPNVLGDSDSSLSVLPVEFDKPDKLLVLFFILLSTALLIASLVPGWESAQADECTAHPSCTYEEGLAVSHGGGTQPLAAAWVDGRESCCGSCAQHAGCGMATFMNNSATHGATVPNCFLYENVTTTQKVAADGTSLCSLPDHGAVSAVVLGSLETLLGGSAMLTRFGGLIFASMASKMLGSVGYGGAGLVSSILAPRKAGTAAARWAAGEAAAGGHTVGVPVAASWDAIAARSEWPPSTWMEARVGLGLSTRQAIWSSGTRILLWHWAQPLSYFVVFGAYYCSLPVTPGYEDGYNSLQGFGTFVAVREAMYVATTLLALWFNPAYLLLELESVWSLAEEAAINWGALKLWVLYLFAPHHYVTMCLLRGRDESGTGWLYLVGIVQGFADLCSVFCLNSLAEMPSPPASLAIGYGLTCAGLVVGADGWALRFWLAARRGVNPFSGTEVDGPCGRVGLFLTGVPLAGGLGCVACCSPLIILVVYISGN